MYDSPKTENIAATPVCLFFVYHFVETLFISIWLGAWNTLILDCICTVKFQNDFIRNQVEFRYKWHPWSNQSANFRLRIKPFFKMFSISIVCVCFKSKWIKWILSMLNRILFSSSLSITIGHFGAIELCFGWCERGKGTGNVWL